MKTKPLLKGIFGIVVLLCLGCAKTGFNTYSTPPEYQEIVECPDIAHEDITDEMNIYFVSEELVRLFAIISSKSGEKWDITTYGRCGKPLFYVINRGGETGWDLVSSDMRTCPILMSGRDRRFKEPKGDTNFSCCYKMMLIELEELRSKNIDLGLTESVLFWKSLQSKSNYHPKSETKSMELFRTNLTSDETGDEGEGEWIQVVYNTNNYSTLLSGVDHLLSTSWHQDYPWNQKCPIEESSHCKVGCVMVAMGQIMFHLNRHFGFPTGLYESVQLQDNIPDDLYLQIQVSGYNANSSRWNQMALNQSDTNLDLGYTQDFLASIGYQLQADYGFHETSMDDLDNSSFNIFGVDCDGDNYDYDEIINNLNNNMPVCTFAQYYVNQQGLNSHAWVIDGYENRRYHYSTTYSYYFVDDAAALNGVYYNNNIVAVFTNEEMDSLFPSGHFPGMQVTDSTSFVVNNLLMNWGEDNDNDSDRCAASSWTFNGNQIGNYDRHVFCNFRNLYE